jgi:hypothetical protein
MLDGGPQAVSVGITLWLRTNVGPARNSLSQTQLAIHVITISLANGVLRFSGKTSISLSICLSRREAPTGRLQFQELPPIAESAANPSRIYAADAPRNIVESIC